MFAKRSQLTFITGSSAAQASCLRAPRSGWRFARSLLLASALIGPSTPAWAQDAGQSEVETASDANEIIIVATRREQALQDVPLAVTAIGEDALRLNQVNSVNDVGSLTPNMISVPGTAGGARSAPQFSIRGQSQQERGGLSDPSVGVYFGDVAIARTQGLSQTLFDVRAVEVIRGPVGTLFGKNATGGAVIIRPNLPTTRGFEGSAGITVAEFGTINADASANIPLGDSFAVRIGGATSNSDGYVFDEALGRNINDTKTYSLRASALLRLGTRFENIAMVNYFNENDGGSGGYSPYLNPAGSIATLAAARNYRPVADLLAEQRARGPLRINNGLPEFNDVDTFDFQNTTTFDLTDNITLKNTFGIRNVNSHILVDLDGTEHPILESEIFDESDQISNEFQIIGNFNQLNFIVGGYFFNETGDNNAASRILGVETGQESSNLFVTGATNNRQLFDNTNYAVFAEGTYEILDGLSLTLGGRYTWENRQATILNRVIDTRCGFTVDNDGNAATPEVNPGDGPGCRLDLDANFNAFTYNVAASYEPDDRTLIYASLRRGFRAGGFAARATTEAGLRRPFLPEFVRNTEIGVKRDWRFGGAFLRTNVAFFHSIYTNVQRQLADTTTANPFTVTVNAARARIQGIEAEVTFRPIRSLELSAFWGHIDAKFTDFIDPFTGADRSSTEFARVPKNTWRVSGTLDLINHPTIGAVSFTATYSGRNSYLDTDNAVVPAGLIRPHEQVDLYLRSSGFLSRNLDLTLFARNVGNRIEELPLASVFPSIGFASRVSGMPRQIGVQLRYNFGR